MLAPSRPVNAMVATSIINKRRCQVGLWQSRPLLINIYVNIQTTKRVNNGWLIRRHLAFAVANCVLNWRFAVAAATGFQRVPQYDGKTFFFHTTPTNRDLRKKAVYFPARSLHCIALQVITLHVIAFHVMHCIWLSPATYLILCLRNHWWIILK